MKADKAEKLFSLMKQYGIEHFKTSELEIKMSSVTSSQAIPVKKVKQGASPDSNVPVAPPPSQAIPPNEMTIPHHVNEVASLLKLNDNDLVDKLFPDYSQGVKLA